MQVRLKLQYDGTNYHGWQRQRREDTVQGRIERALETIFSEPVSLRAAGRTDAGVHALGQVAAFKAPKPLPPATLKRALNALLPPDIGALEAAEAADEFDPRRHARSRVYEYRIANRAQRSVFDGRFSWLVPEPLEVGLLNRAALKFLGEHDFAGFRSVGSEEKSTVRVVHASEWRREGEHLFYRVEASGFLRHMVRTMVALMVEVGRGRLPCEAVEAILRNGDRRRAPAAAPAHGLFLADVRYDH